MTARLCVLASGNGSNLQVLLDACADGRLAARVTGVVTNKQDAFALTRAQRAGVPGAVLALRPFLAAGRTRAEYDVALAELVASSTPDLVVLAGWMLVLGTEFLERFPGRVINLHPALPGQLPGTDAIRRAWLAGQRGELQETGVMVHHVVPEVDAGPVLAMATVALVPGESLAALEERVHATEHRLLIEGVRRALAELTATD